MSGQTLFSMAGAMLGWHKSCVSCVSNSFIKMISCNWRGNASLSPRWKYEDFKNSFSNDYINGFSAFPRLSLELISGQSDATFICTVIRYAGRKTATTRRSSQLYKVKALVSSNLGRDEDKSRNKRDFAGQCGIFSFDASFRILIIVDKTYFSIHDIAEQIAFLFGRMRQ